MYRNQHLHTKPYTVLFQAFLLILLCTLFWSSTAQAKINPKASPPEFVQAIANQALEAVQASKKAQEGDTATINALIDEYVLPYVNFEKTTRLAAGHHWRQATPQQRNALVDAFKNTLISTYGGALDKVNQLSSIKVQPFRGDPNADDVVVRSYIEQRGNPDVAVDYRMEKTPEGWKIYDINVEGIWLIQNYRNQFGQMINERGFDGLIDALNKQNR